MKSTTTKSTPTSRKKVARMRETEKEREPLCRPHSIAFSLSLSYFHSHVLSLSLSLSLFQVIKDEKVPNATATFFPSFLLLIGLESSVTSEAVLEASEVISDFEEAGDR